MQQGFNISTVILKLYNMKQSQQQINNQLNTEVKDSWSLENMPVFFK